MGSSSTMTMRLKQKKLLLRENERGALAFYIDDWVIGLLPAIAGGVKSDESGERKRRTKIQGLKNYKITPNTKTSRGALKYKS